MAHDIGTTVADLHHPARNIHHFALDRFRCRAILELTPAEGMLVDVVDRSEEVVRVHVVAAVGSVANLIIVLVIDIALGNAVLGEVVPVAQTAN